MLTESHIKEGLSRAYILAVAHRAGFNCSLKREFDYGIDGTFYDVKVVGKRHVETGYNIDFQAKASQTVPCRLRQCRMCCRRKISVTSSRRTLAPRAS